jgi:DNA end-binding protein Ku
VTRPKLNVAVRSERGERNELVRGYEVHGHSENDGDYVFFTEEELRALETATSPALDITEFVPLDKIDPTYFESTYDLGPDKGGEKAYALLVKTMADTGLAAVIQLIWRGKENVAAVQISLDTARHDPDRIADIFDDPFGS